MALDGVIRAEGKKEIPNGVHLYRALVKTCRLVIAIDDDDEDAAAYWLKMQGLVGHAEIITDGVPGHLRGDDVRVAQVHDLKGRGHGVDLVVEANAAKVERLVHDGIPVALWMQPKFSRPEDRPDWDGTPRPWDDLMAEIQRQRELAAERRRVDPEE